MVPREIETKWIEIYQSQSSFKFAAAKDWNDPPKELRELNTILSFKTKFLKYFLELDKKQHVCTVK